ncbi:hypothetical protein WMY93_029828 [Mugilogobius chulae]|uniref:Uncharacterized protein n=1 Tax=Mugilogobius chulae TaxID=88201 RepID=A0AAW0MWY5_9GOBI
MLEVVPESEDESKNACDESESSFSLTVSSGSNYSQTVCSLQEESTSSCEGSKNFFDDSTNSDEVAVKQVKKYRKRKVLKNLCGNSESEDSEGNDEPSQSQRV